MIARLDSCSISGIDAYNVDVEAHVASGLPAFSIVGLPDTAIRESRERVKAGIVNSEFLFPKRRIIVSLAPSDIKKEGPSFDLPVALAILVATRQVKIKRQGKYCVVGELALDGSIRRVAGALTFALHAKLRGMTGIIVPSGNAEEAALSRGIDVIAVKSLHEAASFLSNEADIKPTKTNVEKLIPHNPSYTRDMGEVKGQEQAKRALEIAAAGGHNLLMFGPPGSGKTMLAEAFPGILPAMSIDEAIESTMIYSSAKLITTRQPLVSLRPFRNPHHTISDIGLVGGGVVPKPGEISLSHNGVLFLDEINEFPRHVVEVLRQPLETGKIVVSRAAGAVEYPSAFILLASMNPCPCGYLGDRARDCVCSPQEIRNYRAKLSGPLRDRIDIHVEVGRLAKNQILSDAENEKSQAVRARVLKARGIQEKRFRKHAEKVNARMQPRMLRKLCPLDDESKAFLGDAIERLGMTARSYSKVIKLSRTIADLSGASDISLSHISEAIQYRTLDREIRVV